MLGAVYVRLRGQWRPGPWSLGRWGNVITCTAALWLIAEIVNIAWPRASLYGHGYLSWSVLVMMGILAAMGLVTNLWVFRDLSPSFDLSPSMAAHASRSSRRPRGPATFMGNG